MTTKFKKSPYYYIVLFVSQIVFACCTTLHAADYYVSPDGRESNSGVDLATPWPLQYAADKAGPGDTIHLMDGTYASHGKKGNILYIGNGGNANAYVTFRAADGHTPVIYANGKGIWGATVVDAPYVRIENIEFQGDNSNLNLNDAKAAYEDARTGGQDWERYALYNAGGIGIGGRHGHRPHHVEVINCRIHDFPAGGVQATSADYLTIKNNTIYNNAWYTMYAESGISIFHCFNHDDADDYRIIVSRNKVFNNYTQIPWIDYDRLSDGNGIIIDDNRNTQDSNTNGYIEYTGRFLVDNNLIYENGGAGVNVYLSDRVDVVNNTTYANGQVVGYPEISFNNSDTSRSFNNISFAQNGIKAFSVHQSTNITSNFNIYHGDTTNQLGPDDLTSDPLFTSITDKSFTLQDDSPGIDSGGGELITPIDIDGVKRPFGAKIDRGAYEKVSSNPAPNPPTDLTIETENTQR